MSSAFQTILKRPSVPWSAKDVPATVMGLSSRLPNDARVSLAPRHFEKEQDAIGQAPQLVEVEAPQPNLPVQRREREVSLNAV